MTDHLVSLDVQSAKESVPQPLERVPCEVYSRIVGYLRPVRDWNEGKQQEFAERKVFAVDFGQDPTEQEPT